MDREAQRMNRLVRDLLHLSRVEAEERRRPTRPADLAALARMAVATFRPLAEDTGVVLTSSLPETAEIPGDADQLTQVLHNLIENAIKYGGQGGAVAVVLAEDASLGGPGFRITVTDSGEGIAAHHLPRLTERFYRVDDDRSRAKGGTGLGLAIVKHIVQRHRGRLMIDSRPGEGSSFAVVLPAA
jgi:two-component system, OmpR family, phosphate regulon sensor histidine kinase PhoR